MHKKSQRFLILGASRGLGWATYSFLNQKYSDAQFLLVSRKIQNNLVTEDTQKIAQDFSKTPIDQEFLKQLTEFDPTVIIYSAGGGPYGPFETKKWSDHQWALNVNFIYPAQLIHEILNKNNQFQHLKSVTLVGSDVAENKPDQNAAR